MAFGSSTPDVRRPFRRFFPNGRRTRSPGGAGIAPRKARHGNPGGARASMPQFQYDGGLSPAVIPRCCPSLVLRVVSCDTRYAGEAFVSRAGEASNFDLIDRLSPRMRRGLAELCSGPPGGAFNLGPMS